MDNHAFLYSLVAFLGAAVLIVPVCQRFGLGSVLGYLAAGSLLGPWGLRLITNVKSILNFAELGVVLLLFVIGLELKPNRLWVMRKAVFGMGGAQLLATMAVLFAIGVGVGVPATASAIAALGLSLSSTAFALQILAERKQLNTSFGRASFAILLFQDLAVIPVLGLIPFLGPGVAQTSDALPPDLLYSAGKVALVIGGIVVGGRYLLRPLFRLVASAKSKDVFTGAALLVVIGTALIMEAVGLSMALGTFLAGVLLADSEYRHELEADIDPFKGLLLGLFFMAVGMSVDYGLLLRQPSLVWGITFAFMATKCFVVYGVGRLSGFSNEASRNMALVLPQGGEFAFVLFGVAVQNQLLAAPLADTLVLVVTLSMALTPVVFVLNEKYLCPRFNQREPGEFDALPLESKPVIIAGFGRFGQIVGRLLRIQNIEFTALEQDPEQVHLVRRFGNEIYYGDASRLDLLETAGCRKASAFVLAIDDVQSSINTAKVVRENFPQLKIFARARNRQHAFELMDLGITLIHRETFASSLEVARDLLIDLGISPERALETVAKFRKHDQDVLLTQHKFYGDETQMINYSKQAAQQLAELFKADKARG